MTIRELARVAAGRLLPPAEREFILGDLDELHRRWSREDGRGVAAVRYVRALVASAQAQRVARWGASRGTVGPGDGRGNGRGGRGRSFPDLLLQDLRHAARALRRSPAFAFAAIVTLGLGIAGTTTFFSIVHGVLLEPLPYEDAHRLVRVDEFLLERGRPEASNRGGWRMSFPNLVDLRSRAEVFDSLAGVHTAEMRLFESDQPLDVQAQATEPELARVFRAAPHLGRFLREDDRDVAVLSDELWTGHFGADPDIVGKTISLDRRPYVVVGVMPPQFLDEVGVAYWRTQGLPRLWVPLDETTYADIQHRQAAFLVAFGRLAEGVTLEGARASLGQFGAQLAEAYPDTFEGESFWATPLHTIVVGDAASTVWLLFGAGALLLLIGCANVANLQLARLSARRRETAVRRALGAGRARIILHCLVESLVVGLFGGALGVLLAVWGVAIFVALAPDDLPRLPHVGVDATVLAFALIVSVATGLLFGLAPAWRASSAGIARGLGKGGRAGRSGPGARHMRDGLMAGEVALAVLLLAGAGLMANSFLRLWSYDPGFDPENLLTFEMRLDSERYQGLARQQQLYEALQERLEALPEVAAAGEANILPMTDIGLLGAVIPEDRPDARIEVVKRPISGAYFDAMRIPVVAGRPFTVNDVNAVVLNESAVGRIWPDASVRAVVGRRVREPRIRGLPEDRQPARPWLEVVGVVGDTRYQGLDPEPHPEYYYPQSRGGAFGVAYVVVRTRGDPLDAIPAVRRALRELDAQEPVHEVRTMEQVISASMAQPRFYGFLFAVFGVLGLVLASVGVFGVAAYTVARRTREIGVRIAVGATAGDILQLILGRGLAVVAAGLVVGLIAARWLGRFIEGFLYAGVTPADRVTLILVCSTLLLVALLALAIPAHRGIRVNPVDVLREE